MGTRSHRRELCDKPGLCIDGQGFEMDHCLQSSTEYTNLAFPLSEQLCRLAIDNYGKFLNEQPQPRDVYNKIYLDTCYQLDELLNDPYAHREEVLDTRFRTFETHLTSMIDSPQLTEGSKGRYLYHINARILLAYLGPFRFRAEHRSTDAVPTETLEATRRSLGELLEDFNANGLYSDVAQQVALKRTEVEIPLLLLRTKNSDNLIWPALYREEASSDHTYNHDFYSIVKQISRAPKKIQIQVKTNEYRGRGKSRDYSPETMMVIHQQVVNMDIPEQTRIVTRADNVIVGRIDDEEEPYDKFDIERPQVVVWGAGSPEVEGPDDTFEAEFIQSIGGNRRDGLAEAILGELTGRKLSKDESNTLNGATHYLEALLRQYKQQVQ